MSLYNFLSGFSYVSIGSVLIPIVVGFLSRKKDTVKSTLLVLFFTSIISDVSNEIYAAAGMRGYLVINVFFALQFILLCLIYTQLLVNKRGVRSILTFFVIVFTVYSVFFKSIHEYQTVMIVFESFLLLAFAIKHGAEVIQSLPTTNILTYFPTWVNMAVLYYFGFNLFLLALAEYIFKNTSQEVSMVFWAFHNLNNIMKNCLFAAGMYMCFIKKNGEEGEQ